MEFDLLSTQVIRAALKVHSALGPGLFEEVYKLCLKHELLKSGLRILSEVGVPVIYDGEEIDLGYRIDLLVEDMLIVELKSVEMLKPIHKAQLLTYLRLTKKEVGLLINFNTIHLRDGLKRIVNSKPSLSSPSSSY